MNKIIDNLYLGDAYDAIDRKQLQRNNISVIINTAVEVNDGDVGLGISYFKFNWMDDLEFDISKELNVITDLINRARQSKQAVFVHCHMGISRSVSAVIAYLMRHMGYSFSKAYFFVKNKRNIARPNPSFRKQLSMYKPPRMYNIQAEEYFMPMNWTRL